MPLTLAVAALALLCTALSLWGVAAKLDLRCVLSAGFGLLLVLVVLLWLSAEAPLAASLWQVQHAGPLLHCH
ncbi:hypothetical protein [Pseudomonas sp. 5P_3.1_Bac2]|uniref:hypothetical protein n=1 Tax=Pseudomonas sp. 5P_3.1_Bac2 TaxID=2971617 RepID=UPI0021C5A47A|nr:hypothetical protein [Pseudomonas sp. 5P_3.1_Bac2]MCU1719620.1 hypothetical protein [Pseudomonas sp. 5P_3.1_Bac2]